MENTNPKGKNTINVSVKDSAKNLVYNSIIIFLACIIIFLLGTIGYALFGGNNPDQKNISNESPSAIIQTEVLNGCGIEGVADRFTDYLRAKKIDVVNKGNYASFDVEKSIVIDRSGNLSNAKKVARILGIKEINVIQQASSDYFLDVTLVIGKDYRYLNPLK